MSVLKIISTLLIFGALTVLGAIFWPVTQAEIEYGYSNALNIKYSLNPEFSGTYERTLKVPNKDFSIAIPKIAAAAPIIANVDPQNKYEYLRALKQGVAQAKGTAVPGETGNVYLFAHSEDTFYNVNTYNAPFFLLGKLTRGDEIYVFYKDRKFKYVVDQVKVVSPEEVNYLTVNPDRNTLTLQTDYPPGMTFARRIVIADEIGIE